LYCQLIRLSVVLIADSLFCIMQRLRNIFIFALPVVLLLQLTLGALLWMALREMHRHKVKHEILQAIPDHQLVDVVLSPTQVKNARFKDKGKEIFWNGRMYDIIKKRIENGKLILRCFDDGDETILALRAQKAGEESSKNTFNTILRQFVLIGTDELSKPIIPVAVCNSERILFAEPDFRETSCFIDVLAPPPDTQWYL
jgi:hypothetical protein